MTENQSKCRVTACIIRCYQWKVALGNKFMFVLHFLIRLTLAQIFWTAGTLKLPTGFLKIGKGDWDSTLLLFREEYHVPLLSPHLAAYLATSVEIIAPVLLVLGLGSRVAAAALFVLTLVIELSYQHSMEHILWMLLAAVIMLQGGGCLSLDSWIRRKCPSMACCKKE